MPRFSGDEQRERLADWATTAGPETCAACGQPFQPRHPRQRFCKKADCPGRKAPSGPKRKDGQPSGRQIEAQRRVGVQGVLADVLLEVHGHEVDGTLTELRSAVRAWIEAEQAGRPAERRAALVHLQAVAAVRTLACSPPGPVETDG